jgi:dolichyl-phosphate-mannose-protein mannosyltransferase
MSDNAQRFSIKAIPWYTWAMTAIFVLSLALRFWGLGRFNVFVFDEVYYAKFANNYLTNTPFFNAHPPLSQYIIAIGIWLGDMLPIGQDTANTLTGSLRTTFSYRWFNAIFGSLVPPAVGFLAYQLTQRHTYMVIASLLMAMDGLYLVDSRYALNNVFLMLFGILGQLLLLVGLNKVAGKRWAFLTGAGIFFGLSIACKWNGLWFLVSIWLLLAVIVLNQIITSRPTTNIPISANSQPSVLTKLSNLRWWEIIVFLLAVPAIIYAISWIPHLIQNPKPDFFAMQDEIMSYHKRVGNGKDVHPYCANWYTWPLMMRPLAYYYEVVKDPTGPVIETIYDVHAIGNPFLWWLAFGVIIVMTWRLFKGMAIAIDSAQYSDADAELWLTLTGLLIVWIAQSYIHVRWLIWLDRGLIVIITLNLLRKLREKNIPWDLSSPSAVMPVFLLANYGANLFPWIPVTRCLYIYHYMGSLIYAILALAWFVDRWLHSSSRQWRANGVTAVFVIALGFAWWMPIYLGLPLDRTGLSLRMWFNSETWKTIGEMWNWI